MVVVRFARGEAHGEAVSDGAPRRRAAVYRAHTCPRRASACPGSSLAYYWRALVWHWHVLVYPDVFWSVLMRPSKPFHSTAAGDGAERRVP